MARSSGEVLVRLVAATVFKTVGPYGDMRSVGSIPMHFRHFWGVAAPGYERRCRETNFVQYRLLQLAALTYSRWWSGWDAKQRGSTGCLSNASQRCHAHIIGGE